MEEERQQLEIKWGGDVMVFNSLPDELQLFVFERLLRVPPVRRGGGALQSAEQGHLVGGDLFRAMLVCRQWHRLCTSDELWQTAYLTYMGNMNEEKARKIKARFYELKNSLVTEQDSADEQPTDMDEEKHKRKRLKQWVKAHIFDGSSQHQQPAPRLSWRELTRTKHAKMKKLMAIKLKPLPETAGEKLLEIVSNSDDPDGEIKARYLNSINPNVSEETDTTRVVQSDTPLVFLPPVPGQRSNTMLTYFESKVEDKGQKGYISVGVAPLNFDQHNIQVGWDPRSNSYGMHGDDGHKYPALFDSAWSWMGEEYGPQFTTGDVVGCGMILRKISEEEAAKKTLQELDRRAKAWRRKMVADWGVKEEVTPEPKTEDKEEPCAESERQDSAQEQLYSLLDWDDRMLDNEQRKPLFSRAKALFGKDKLKYRTYIASIFWTKNGQYLGIGFNNIIITESGDYRPSVGMHSPGECISFNFGRFPFSFDVDDFMLNYPSSLNQPTPPPFKRAESEGEDEVYSEGEFLPSSEDSDDEMAQEDRDIDAAGHSDSDLDSAEQ